MVKIGRGQGRGVYVPNNRTMFVRANKQLEAHAASHAKKHQEALRVDGPRFAFWRKLSGSIPCSCVAVKDPAKATATVSPGEENKKHAAFAGSVFNPSRARQTYTGDDDFGFVEYNQATTYEDTVDKLTSRDKSKFLQDDSDDILDAMDGVEEPALVDFDDPFNLFSNKLIECPVCFGQSYIDSWQLHNGLRAVFDTSNAYKFECHNAEIDNSGTGPAKIHLTPKGMIYWTYKFPMYFNEVVRVRVYNGTEVIDPELYEFDWTTEDDTLTGNADALDLPQLIGVDKTVNLIFKSAYSEELTITHAEIVLTLAPFDHCQLPEVEAAYEEAFMDWNVSVNAEIPAGLQVKEGDYFCDEKYKRVWKINTINRRVTAGGTQFGSGLDIRVLHSFEKLMSVLNIFK